MIEAVPPQLYGGTERIVAYLTDALVELGHEVTLFASADSQTKAELAPAWPSALRLDKTTSDPVAPHISMLETVARRADEFDKRIGQISDDAFCSAVKLGRNGFD